MWQYDFEFSAGPNDGGDVVVGWLFLIPKRRYSLQSRVLTMCRGIGTSVRQLARMINCWRKVVRINPMLYQSGKIRRQVQKRVRPQVDKTEELKDE